MFVDGQLHPTHAVGQTVFTMGAMKTGRDLDGTMNLADKFPNGLPNPFGRDGDIDKDFTIRAWRFEKYNKKFSEPAPTNYVKKYQYGVYH